MAKKYIEAEQLKGFMYTGLTGNDLYTPNGIEEFVDGLPTADVVEVKPGRWEHYEHREPQYDLMGVKTWAEAYKCSNCGFIHTVIEDFGHYAYCPNCGAKMQGEEDE